MIKDFYVWEREGKVEQVFYWEEPLRCWLCRIEEDGGEIYKVSSKDEIMQALKKIYLTEKIYILTMNNINDPTRKHIEYVYTNKPNLESLGKGFIGFHSLRNEPNETFHVFERILSGASGIFSHKSYVEYRLKRVETLAEARACLARHVRGLLWGGIND